MNQSLLVTKRDGGTERINLDKIHRVLDWAAEGLSNVSISQVELRSHIQFYDGIKTSDIHETIIKAAADLISRDAPDYQYLAARLAIFHLRKKAYGQFEPPALYDHVKKMIELGKYDHHLLEDYTEEEFKQMDSFIEHDRDMTFSYAAVKQLEGKYLVQNRVTGEIYESAQFLYILVAACLFSNYPRETRLDYIKRFYDAVSTFKISLPTPIMSGVRTPTRQFSSCVLIECGDSLDSINATSSAIVKYVSQRAGIGINAGRIRALGSPIRGGEAFHTGCIPFYKHFQTAVKSCSQGGVRGGAATLFYPMWHLEVESLLVLKNNRGVEGKIRAVQYARENNVPYLGLCLGMQCAVMEFARHVVGLEGATSSEFHEDAKFPVIDLMPDQVDISDKGGTMRLGLYPCKLTEGTKAHDVYGTNLIYERHRHRWEFNNKYRTEMVNAGLVLSGTSPDDRLVEIVELKDHPWFVGCQFHPEFKSRPTKAHPLFKGLIKTALELKGE